MSLIDIFLSDKQMIAKYKITEAELAAAKKELESLFEMRARFDLAVSEIFPSVTSAGASREVILHALGNRDKAAPRP